MSRIVTLHEAAEEVGLSAPTVWRYIRLGLLKKYRRQLDRRTYVDLDELRELKDNPPFHEAR